MATVLLAEPKTCSGIKQRLQTINIQIFSQQQFLMLLMHRLQQGAVYGPVAEAQQGSASIGLGIKNHHKQKRQLPRTFTDIAAHVFCMKPGKTATINLQVITQRRKQALVRFFLALQFDP